MQDDASDFLNGGPIAQRHELCCIGQRNGVFKLGPRGTLVRALDGQKSLLARDAHAHRALLVAVQVALAEPGAGALAPGIAGDEKLAFDFSGQGGLRKGDGIAVGLAILHGVITKPRNSPP